MTNLERLQTLTAEELSGMLCHTMEGIAEKTKNRDWCCDICPAGDLCKKGCNGFQAWLAKEETPEE